MEYASTQKSFPDSPAASGSGGNFLDPPPETRRKPIAGQEVLAVGSGPFEKHE